jgi:hypothetical protein
MSSKYVIRYRLLVLLFTFLNLAVFALNSANIHFATILRERARSGYVDNSQVILDIIFAALQSDVLVASVVAAVPAALFSVFGLVLALQPRWLARQPRYHCDFHISSARGRPVLHCYW